MGLVLLLAALTGCGGDAAAPPTIEAPPPIRLIDHLAEAEVASPLLTAPAPDSLLAEIDQGAGSEFWSTRFEVPGDYRQQGCRQSDGGGVECDKAGRGIFQLSLAVPAAASGATVIVLDLQAERPGCVTVELWDEAERVRLPLPGDATSWRRLPILWPARRQSGEISLRLLPRRLPGPCRLAVRSVSAHALAAGPELRLALLRGRQERRTAGGEAGIGGFGGFLPLADAETVQPPFDENFSSREVLLAPTPTEARFRLRLPKGARLGFSYALSRESALGDRVDFEVRVKSRDGIERALWSDRIELTPENWHWHEASVPLEELGGRTVELVLATRSPSGVGMAVWGTPTVAVPRRTGEPPNVILIAVDTLRADRLSAYGYGAATSPRLEAFAEDGVLFRHAVSQSNWTLPSFASIFTGKIVARHGLATFASRLPPGAVTLQGLLRDHGWRTHAVLYKAALYQRLDRGFETSFNVPARNHLADRNLAAALDWLRLRRQERFFLFLHFDDPHQPFTQPAEFLHPASVEELGNLELEMPLDLLRRLPECARCVVDGQTSAAVKALASQLYDEEIRYVDDRIGRFLDELRRLGLYDEAVIAFVSDHGETIWTHYDYYQHGGANLHDELIRVPLIIKPPAAARFRRGAVAAGRVAAFDLMPTLLELAGIDRPPQLDARSLVPLLRAADGAPPAEDRIAFSQGSSSAAFLHEQWKYLMPVGRGVPPSQISLPALAGEALYDLRADPGELRNLAAAEPARTAALRELAIEYVVGSVGGRFLLVGGGADAAALPLEVACGTGCLWDPLLQFGREMGATDSAGVTSFDGRGLGDGVLLLARLAAAPGETVRVRSATAGTPGTEVVATTVAFEPGIVGSLLRPKGLGAWILSAAERGDDVLEESTLDPRQEETLRALGYLQ